MSFSHAVLSIDHHSAQVLRFDAEHVQTSKVKEHTHHTPQHGSGVRTEHEFFAEVCAELAGIAEVLVAASHQTQADFRHYVGKHRPLVASQIVGWETIDHPTEGQLVAFARKYFIKYDRMAGTAPP